MEVITEKGDLKIDKININQLFNMVDPIRIPQYFFDGFSFSDQIGDSTLMVY